MITCYSLRDDCWRVFLLWDWPLRATYLRVGPSFPSKAQANDYIASVRRGAAGLSEPTERNGGQP